MMTWFLNALGVNVEDVDGLTGWSLRWETAQWGALAAVLTGVLLLLSWWLYRGGPQAVSRGRRFFLFLLRAVFLVLLAAILLQPVLILSLEREVPRTLPILIDRTGSMMIEDQQGRSRIETVQSALLSPGGVGMRRSLEEDLEVPLFSFNEGVLAEWDEASAPLVAAGDRTALGEAARKVLDRYRGVSLAGMLLITDGGQNSGVPLATTVEQLKEAGVPIFAVGVGDSEARDVSIEAVEVREVLLAEDAAPVRVKLRTQGMKGERGRIVFSLGGVDVSEEEVRIEEDGPQEISTLFIPKKAGDYAMRARFEADNLAEVMAENNEGQAGVRVVDRRLRVLLLDQAPRWEFKYLEAMLLRERRVELSCFLLEADRDSGQADGSPYLPRLPNRPETLYDFDLIVLGDIDPRLLPEGYLSLLGSYVSQAGGALTVIAGKRFMPSAYGQTELQQLLPVELAGASIASSAEPAVRPIKLALTPEGRESVMLRLGDSPEESEARWDLLPPVYWAARVERAKPAASVLLTRPDASTGSREAPVLALHRYGAGEVLFLGTDNLWRFRRNVGDRYHTILWGQMIQRMAGARLLTEAPRVILRANGRSFAQGDRVRIYAKLFTQGWEPREDEVVDAVLAAGSDPSRRQEVLFRAIPGEPGSYRAEFAAGPPGNYRVAVSGDDIATVDFTVTDNNREYGRAALNEPLLRDLAHETGGAYIHLRDFERVPSFLTERSARVASIREVDLWSSPLFFALIMLVLSAEWIGRKLSELK